MFVHATCVHVNDVSVLRREPFAADEYDCAVRIIDASAKLDAEGEMQLATVRSDIIAAAPAKIAMALKLWGGAFRQARAKRYLAW